MTTRTRILAGMATALVAGYVLGYYFGGGVHTSQHQVLTSRELTCLSTYAAALQRATYPEKVEQIVALSKPRAA
jgi:hypothetical protein